MNGADINDALMIACQDARPALVQEFINRGANEFKTALKYTLALNEDFYRFDEPADDRVDVVKILLNVGADIDYVIDFLNTCENDSDYYSDLKIELKYLIDECLD